MNTGRIVETTIILVYSTMINEILKRRQKKEPNEGSQANREVRKKNL